MLIYGHGGAGPNGLNRAASFPAIAASGADGVELDVRLSADQQLTGSHDPDYGDGRAVATVDAAEETVAVCVGHGHQVIHPYESMVDDTFMAVARSHDLAVNLWTGPQETAGSIEKFRSLGFHGIITARPRRAAAMLRGYPTR